MTDPERLHELCRLRSTLEAFAVRRWPRARRLPLEQELRRHRWLPAIPLTYFSNGVKPPARRNALFRARRFARRRNDVLV